LKTLATFVDRLGPWGAILFVSLFLASSFLLIWRLEAMSERGVEGTVLGTLFMPYCSGVGNLLFAFILGRSGGSGAEVVTNSIVNNVTNMTLLLGLPALLWGLSIAREDKIGKPREEKAKWEAQLQRTRLALLLTMSAVLFFTGSLWVLALDGRITRSDGFTLVGLFLLWQCYHVFNVLKTNLPGKKSPRWSLLFDLMFLGIGAYGTYLSVDWLVNWLSKIHEGFVSAKYLGWLTGWLMVLPNGLLALYYGWRRRADVTYSSQVGDGHICIPLCVGIFALYDDIILPAFFERGMMMIILATLVHFFFVATLGRLPRLIGGLLITSYGIFLYTGLI
jgi:cation:H+ antiporter